MNNRGRTPLMEAALLGRLEVVSYLLANGAATGLEDEAGRTALDLAKDSSQNSSERRRRCGQDYDKDKHELPNQRRIIASYLGFNVPPVKTDSGFHINEHVHFSKSFPRITLYAEVDGVQIKAPYKTVAFLERGTAFDTVSSVSGWTSVPDTASHQLDNARWTDEVLKLYSFLHIDTPLTPEDQGVAGRYDACHAEAQLMAYFLHKHVRESEMDAQEANHGSIMKYSSDRCKNMPEKLIVVSTKPCRRCVCLRDTIDETFKVRFRLKYCPHPTVGSPKEV